MRVVNKLLSWQATFTPWAWVPVPALLLAMVGLWAADLRGAYPAPRFLFVMQLVFMTLTSGVIACLVARSFLARGSPELLLLGCGIMAWGLAGIVAGSVSRGDFNTSVTIHNLTVWLSASCHLTGVILASPTRAVRERNWFLLAALAFTVGAVAVISRAASAGWTPLFFVQGQGGTIVRQLVLGSAVAMFLVSGLVLQMVSRARPEHRNFSYWYGLGLLLNAAGLFGVLIQSVHSGVLGWVGVATQWLAGIYLLVAALTAARASGTGEISLAVVPRDVRVRYGLAVVFVVMATVLRLVFFEAWDLRIPYLMFYPAVMLAALYGGWGPGLLAAIVAALAATYDWSHPVGHVLLSDSYLWLPTVFFLVNSLAMIGLTEAMQRARARIKAAEAEAGFAVERQRAIEALQQSDERLRMALDGARMTTFDCDLTAAGLPHSNAGHDHVGAGLEHRIVSWGVNHAEDAEALRTLIVDAIIRRGEFVGETRIIHPDIGEIRWFEIRGKVVCDSGGEAVRVVGVAVDISERKCLEQALREADSRKDEFIAMLGHELRNPLGAIASAASLLAVTGSPDQSAERARAVIGRQVKHLSRLVDDLLDVSRVTSGKVVLLRQPIDLAAFVTELLAGWQSSGRFERRHVSVDVAPVWVEADETRLEQVLANLLGNALKYTPSGGAITIRVDAAGDTALLQVADTGVGISPALINRVFDLFVQGEPAIDRAHGGLGIGLTLVKVLVEMHGGTVEVTSPGQGKGAVFTVRFPRIPGPIRAGKVVPRIPCASRRRILVVEDNADAREMLRMQLALAGHEVHEAADGPTGVRLAATMHPDVGLIDVGLPGMDGYEVSRRIRATEVGKSILLIALTGYGQPEDRRRALDAGFDAHVTKPVLPDRLAELIAGSGPAGVSG